MLVDATVLLLQLEIPVEVAMNAAKVAQEMGVKVILDPSPMLVNFPNDFYGLIDIITPNEESPQFFTYFSSAHNPHMSILSCRF